VGKGVAGPFRATPKRPAIAAYKRRISFNPLLASRSRRRIDAPITRRYVAVGNVCDPATPYSGSLAMAAGLARARLLTVAGYGYTALLNPSTCLDGYGTAYFLTGALPPPLTVCQQDQVCQQD
jgi:TAP-like protein